MDDDVKLWIKRSNRKNAKLISVDAGVYRIVYYDKGKARVGVVQDGMYCRYGVSCLGAMAEPDIMRLWQSGPGACTQDDVKVMIDYLNETCTLPSFDFGVIKNLKH